MNGDQTMTQEHLSDRRLGGPAIAGLACVVLLAACSKAPAPAETAAAAPAPVAQDTAAAPAVDAVPPAAAVETATTPADASALAPAAPPEAMTPAALEELLAPIALYPDSLLGVLLTSATHPQEVMDGGNWLLQQKATGEALDAEAEKAGFGPSMRALLQFPTVVDMMCQNFDWTQQLGSAMNTDQTAVLAAVQRLRGQAVDSGNLKSSPQMKVSTKTIETQKVVVVESPEPKVVYVPQYDPQVVYQPAVATTAAPVPAVATTTTTVTEKGGPSTGDVIAAGIFGFAAGAIVANIFDDDDDRYPYPYPSWGYGGMYYGGSAWYGGGYVYRPNYGYGGYGGYRPGYGYRPPVNYPNAWNRPGSWSRPPIYTRPGINNNNVFINVNNQNNYYNRFDDKKNLRVADAQRPQLVSPKVRKQVDTTYRPPSRPMPAGAVNSQGRPGGMQPGERRDDRTDWKGQSGYQGARPGVAGAGGVGVGSKVPQNVPKISDRDVRDKLPAGNQRPAVERPAQRPAVQQRPAVERPAQRPAVQQRPAVERPAQRPAAQQRPAVERPQQRPAMERPAPRPESRPMPQQRPAVERPTARPESRPMPQQRPAAERAPRTTEQRRDGGARQREGR
jgi:hypothetical protein